MDPMTVLVEHENPASAAHQDLFSRQLQGVSSLFAVRTDLRGVHAFADVVEESVRWSA